MGDAQVAMLPRTMAIATFFSFVYFFRPPNMNLRRQKAQQDEPHRVDRPASMPAKISGVENVCAS